jgi:TolA-binding protein
MNLSRLAVPAVAFLLGGTGCAWLTQNHAASAQYAREVEVAQMRAADLEAQIGQASRRIEQLEATVREHGQTEQTRLENLDQVNTEINSLRGQIEQLQFQVTEMQRYLDDGALSQERRMLHAERRLDQLEKFLKVKPPPPPTDEELGIARTGTPTTPPVTPPADCTPLADGSLPAGCAPATPPIGPDPEVPASPATAKEALDLAVQNMKDGRQGVARVLLEKAIEDHPGAPELPVIRYRIGETWFNEGEFKKAAKAFQAVVDNHGNTDWAAWAMYRQGECFDSLNQADNAKLFYQSCVDNYPRSEAAKEAKKKLAR